MTIKRKTQLNLSGSHRTLDADNAFVGGFLFVTGSVSASVGVSASVLEGTTVTAADTISGSTGRFTYLSGALSASSTGLPFLVAGSNVTTTFSHTDLNWTIAATGGGGGGTVQGSDTQVQFNNNGAFAASSSLTHYSGTLGVHALSGSLTSSGTVFADALQYNGNILKITSNVLVTQSVMFFEGIDPTVETGGVVLVNGASLNMFSGSGGEDPPFGINPSNIPDQVYVGVRGELQLTSGSLTVNSGSGEDKSFTIEPSNTAGQVDVIFDRTGSTEGVKFGGINVRPLYSTGSSTVGQLNFILSGDLLASGYSGWNSVGKVDFSVIAVQKDTDNYAAWTFTATVAKDTIGAVTAIGYAELEMTSSGPTAANWDVNVNSDASIACSGSDVLAGTPISWYAQVTKKMFLSGSGQITY